MLFLLFWSLWTGHRSLEPELDLTVRYMFYACDPCPYEYRVERSTTDSGRSLLGHDIAIGYRGKPFAQSPAFPAITPLRNRFRLVGHLRPRSLSEWLSSGGERTVDTTRIKWLR